MIYCCACRSDSSTLVCTFTPLQNSEEQTIAVVLNEIAGFKLVDESKKELATYICQSCIKRAEDAQEFKQMILKSHQHNLEVTTTCAIKTEQYIKEEPELTTELDDICDMIDNEDMQLIQDFQIKIVKPPECKPNVVERKLYNTRKKKINFKLLINNKTKIEKNNVVKAGKRGRPVIVKNRMLKSNERVKPLSPHNLVDNFKCYKCKHVLSSKGNLKTHMLIHTKERRFQCSYCPKKFRQNQTLMVHTRIHTKELPFKCKYCPKAFRQKSNQDLHIKRWHKI